MRNNKGAKAPYKKKKMEITRTEVHHRVEAVVDGFTITALLVFEGENTLIRLQEGNVAKDKKNIASFYYDNHRNMSVNVADATADYGAVFTAIASFMASVKELFAVN